MSATTLPANETEARRKAREIIDSTRSLSLLQTVALAYLEGKVAALREMAAQREAKATRHDFTRAEYDCICQRCGNRAGSRWAAVRPEHGYFEVVCFHCSSGDEPRAA